MAFWTGFVPQGGGGVLKRANVSYTGRVQGVGFRYTARAASQTYAVDGFVKNITDGSVQVVAEGDDREIAVFLDDLEGRMRGYIRERAVVWEEPTGEFEGFSVRF